MDTVFFLINILSSYLDEIGYLVIILGYQLDLVFSNSINTFSSHYSEQLAAVDGYNPVLSINCE